LGEELQGETSLCEAGIQQQSTLWLALPRYGRTEAMLTFSDTDNGAFEKSLVNRKWVVALFSIFQATRVAR
jgi:hypothetical protein